MSEDKTLSRSTVQPKDVLRHARTIAVVGASKNPEKEANTVPEYLKKHGYKIIPVNPSADRILDEKAYPNLLDIPADLAREIEVVDVFRPSEELVEVAKRVVELQQKHGRPIIFWAQLGLENEEAKQILLKNGVPYVMNECMRIVHGQISSEHRARMH